MKGACFLHNVPGAKNFLGKTGVCEFGWLDIVKAQESRLDLFLLEKEPTSFWLIS